MKASVTLAIGMCMLASAAEFIDEEWIRQEILRDLDAITLVEVDVHKTGK